MATPKTTFRIPPFLKQYAEKRAAELGITLNDLVLFGLIKTFHSEGARITTKTIEDYLFALKKTEQK